MKLFNSIATWYLKKRVYQIEMFTKHPIETQMEVFDTLIKTASSTDWGKKYAYGDIQSIEQFQERVPISTYEQIYPYIERVLNGEKDVLWPGTVKWFSKSSGTTNDKSKFIPITKESLDDCHYKGGKDMLALYFNERPDSQLFSGRALSIGGSRERNNMNPNAYYGDLSAVLIENLPLFFQIVRVPKRKIALMGEWEKKIELMARDVMSRNISSIAGVPTWSLVLFNKIFELAGLESRNLLEIWPNLEVFFHGGVSFMPYRKQFEAIIPSDQMWYFENYNASEGFFGLQTEKNSDDLLLMLDYGIFYEFIPLDELGKEHPKALTLEQVESGKTYALVISTNAGLWRYLIGDTITFTQTNPFKIKVAGRTKHFINAFGEELMVENVESALSNASDRTGAIIANFTVAPIFFEGQENGAHEWLIEFQNEPDDFEHFSELLDNHLKSLNSDYEAKRYKDMALRPPHIRKMPEGTFYNWMKSRGKLGGQNKVPRLFNTREYVDSILKMLPPSGQTPA